jgi:hypothetical protein
VKLFQIGHSLLAQVACQPVSDDEPGPLDVTGRGMTVSLYLPPAGVLVFGAGFA